MGTAGGRVEGASGVAGGGGGPLPAAGAAGVPAAGGGPPPSSPLPLPAAAVLVVDRFEGAGDVAAAAVADEGAAGGRVEGASGRSGAAASGVAGDGAAGVPPADAAWPLPARPPPDVACTFVWMSTFELTFDCIECKHYIRRKFTVFNLC